jgi:CMP-N-acetylneuraminic acid synthetase
MEVLAIVPARGGSKRLPGKNVKRIQRRRWLSNQAGQGYFKELRSLVAIATGAAADAPSVGRVVLSTDDKEIQEAAEGHYFYLDYSASEAAHADEQRKLARYGGNLCPFIRPAHLATDTATSEDVIVHAIDWLRDEEAYTPDLVVLLQATSPLRTATDVEMAIDMARTQTLGRRRFVVSKAWTGRRWALNGAIYIGTPDMIRGMDPLTTAEDGSTVGGWEPCAVYRMPPERSVDIDTAADFDRAEWLASR